MKTLICILATLLINCAYIIAQSQVYSASNLFIASKTGNLTRALSAPKTNETCNAHGHCFKYQRNTNQKYDNIKFNVSGKLIDVGQYASHEASAPKIKMKVYTTAPVGTVIEIQLGKRGGIAYPDGTHSQYQATTTVSNEWEELEFAYSVSPEGSHTTAHEVNQLTLLFNPNSQSNDIYYFEEITGPPIGVEPVPSASIAPKKENN